MVEKLFIVLYKNFFEVETKEDNFFKTSLKKTF